MMGIERGFGKIGLMVLIVFTLGRLPDNSQLPPGFSLPARARLAPQAQPRPARYDEQKESGPAGVTNGPATKQIRYLMGTLCEITAYAPPEAEGSQARTGEALNAAISAPSAS